MTVTDEPSTEVARRPVGELVLYGPLDAADTLVYGVQSILIGALAFVYQDWLPWVRDDTHAERLDKADRIAGAAGGKLTLREREAWRERRDRRMRRSWQTVTLAVLLGVAVCVSGFTPWPSVAYGLGISGVMVVLAVVVDSKEAARWLLRLCVLPCVCSVPFGITAWRWWPAAVLCVLLVAACVWRGVNVTPPAPSTAGGGGSVSRRYSALWASTHEELLRNGVEAKASGGRPVTAEGDEVGVVFPLVADKAVTREMLSAIERVLALPLGGARWFPSRDRAGGGELNLRWRDVLDNVGQVPKPQPFNSSSVHQAKRYARGQLGAPLMLNRLRKHMIVLGGTGCIAPWTRIYLPDRDEHVRVDTLAAGGESVTVQAWDPSRGWVRAQTDGPPYVKGAAALYEVRCSDGATMTVTGQHRFLTPIGWRRLDSLHVGQLLAAPAPAPAALVEAGPCESRGGVLRCSGTPEGCRGGCSTCLRRCDRPLLRWSGSARVGSPSPDGAPIRGRSTAWLAGVLASGRSRSRTCRRGSRAVGHFVRGAWPWSAVTPQLLVSGSTTTSLRPGGAHTPSERSILRLRTGAALRPELRGRGTGLSSPSCDPARTGPPTPAYGTSASQLPMSLRSAARSLCTAGSPRHVDDELLRGSAPIAFSQAYDDGIRWVRVENVRSAGEGVYYDLTVPGPACYVAEGLLNHNSGKTSFGWRLLDDVAENADEKPWGIDLRRKNLIAPYVRMFEGRVAYTVADAEKLLDAFQVEIDRRVGRIAEQLEDEDDDNIPDENWIPSAEPGREQLTLFVDELTSLTPHKTLRQKLAMIEETGRQAACVVVLLTPDLDASKIKESSIHDQPPVKVVMATSQYDIKEMFGAGASAAGWGVPATWERPRDAGKLMISSDEHLDPEVYRADRLEVEDIKARRKWRRAEAQRETDEREARIAARDAKDGIVDAEVVTDEDQARDDAIRAALDICGDREGLPVREIKGALGAAAETLIRAAIPPSTTYLRSTGQSERCLKRSALVSALQDS